MIKNVKNGDKISVSKTKDYKYDGVEKELKAGVNIIDNADYLLANALEAKEGNVETKTFIEKHPHTWKDKK